MLNDSTLSCRNCVYQLVCEIIRPLEDVCDLISEPQVSDDVENIG